MAVLLYVTTCFVSVLPLVFAQSASTYVVSVAEEQNGGIFVADIVYEARLFERYDTSIINQLGFSIYSTNVLDTEYFSIQPRTSRIITRRIIDRETICLYQTTCEIRLDITVAPVEYFEVLKFVVRISDVNDHSPTFTTQTTNLSIPESAQIGASFELEPAEDLDVGENTIQTYTLLNYETYFDIRALEISEGTHQLSLVLKTSLNREQLAMLPVRIVASDGGTPSRSGSTTLTVMVLDINDNSPTFENTEYEQYINENVDVGSSVLTVRAIDNDEGLNGEVVYEFSRQTQSQYGHLFSINTQTGLITTQDVIDYEQGTQYSLRIMAKDRGASSLAGYTQVTVYVRDRNDNTPQISVNTQNSNNQVSVAENQDPGTFVTHIRVIDPDGGDNGRVTCSINNSNNFALVELSPKEYKIETVMSFNRETVAAFTITMTCNDLGTPPKSSSLRIAVLIEDVNDHIPAFSQQTYEARLLENSGVDITVIQVNATDYDTGSNAALSYELQSVGLYANDVLMIDSQTGIVKTRVSLDYELQQQYAYHVIVRDHGIPARSASANLILNVLDINDEPPTFSQPQFSFSVRENTPYNAIIWRVIAYDLDSPPYNTIVYSFVSQGLQENFAIDENTGDIRVTTILDREEMEGRHSYNLIVRASNAGFGLQSLANVTIFVEDDNDHVPSISFPTSTNYTFNVKSNTRRNTLVTQVHASDRDIGRNGQLSYAIIRQSNSKTLFAINQNTGEIYVDKDLSDFGNREVEIRVQVNDNGDTPLRDSVPLTIFIDKVAASTEGRLVSNLTFVIAVIVTSVVLVAIAVVVFIIFMLRRQGRSRKAPVYLCAVEEQQGSGEKTREGATDVDRQNRQLETVCGVVTTTSRAPWPDVIDINQIGLENNAYCTSGNQSPTGNNYISLAPPTGKRVTFKDSLENIAGQSKDGASARGAIAHRGATGAQGKKALAMCLDEGRHKLLYGGGGGMDGSRPSLQLTSHNIQAMYRAADGDQLSDQGSSIDSGRGPSEEDPDPLRSSGLHNHSLNDSRESGESANRATNYMDMNKARRYGKLGASSNNKAPTPTKGMPSCEYQPSRKHNPKRNDPESQVKHARNSSSSSSHRSSLSTPPIVSPRGAKPTQNPHPNRPTHFKNTTHSFPDLNVPNPESHQKSQMPSQNGLQRHTNTVPSTGRYNVRYAAASGLKSQPPLYPPASVVAARNVHKSIDNFPMLYLPNQRMSSANTDADSRSEGGSSTSGSYMIGDNHTDCLDLGPEVSKDVFV